MIETTQKIEHGIHANLTQIIHQLIQVFLVGLTIGMTRVVLSGLADSEFGLASQSYLSLTFFVVIFGCVKAVMNLFAGYLSDRIGRRLILILGWVFALPIPILIFYSTSWTWILAAMFFLGLNQGLCWSMTLNSKLDLASHHQKGLINGLNEFAGYVAVAIAGWATAVLAISFGPRETLLWFGLSVIGIGLLLSIWKVVETMPWSHLHPKVPYSMSTLSKGQPSVSLLSLKDIFYFTLKNRKLLALNQAGLVEKFTDTLVWIFIPVFLLKQSQSLVKIGVITAIYGLTWGSLQLLTGPLSDKYGRRPFIISGFGLCGLSTLCFVHVDTPLLWSLLAASTGIGMAMLYPTLSAAVADVSEVSYRSSVLGVYRFWRDFGYAIGGLLMGALAMYSQSLHWPFYFVGMMMILSGIWLRLSI